MRRPPWTSAASYLRYDKPDSFRRARIRHPIPGETRTTDGRPAWTPATLQAWRTTPGHPAAANQPGYGTANPDG